MTVVTPNLIVFLNFSRAGGLKLSFPSTPLPGFSLWGLVGRTELWKNSVMSTLAEIEAAVPNLSVEELAELEEFVRAERKKVGVLSSHSVLDIPAANVGRMLQTFPGEDDDLLGEMSPPIGRRALVRY